MRAILMCAVVVGALLSGCSDSGSKSLQSIFGDDADQTLADQLPNGTDEEVLEQASKIRVITGSHLEGRVGNGTWAALTTNDVGAPVSGPAMTTPAPTGGGGDRSALPVTGQMAEVRIKEYDQLSGYRVLWVLAGEEPEMDATGAPVTRPADETYSFNVSIGTLNVYAALYEGKPSVEDLPAGAFEEPATFRFTATFTISGEVQPVRPGGAGGVQAPQQATREEMVDVYTFVVPQGSTVSATTVFNGAATDGTDVDLGLFDGTGTGVECVGTGGSTATVPLAPDPAQAAEQLAPIEIESTGEWSIQVGAMQDGCSGQTGWYYNNHAPVPYTLTIRIE